MVELGEPLHAAVRRELEEETGLIVEVGPLVEVFDRIHRDDTGRVRFHFVIFDYVCRAADGDATPGSDADAVAWVTAEELPAYGVNPHAATVVRKALAVATDRAAGFSSALDL